MTETPVAISLRRTEFGRYEATNAAGVTLTLGQGDDCFAPLELLLVALAGCSSIDVDYITSRRAEPVSFEVSASGVKVSDPAEGNRMSDLTVNFSVSFPEGAGGDEARARLPQAVKRSHDGLCTVSRTLEAGTPVEMTVA